jgi:hypothetical protein
MGYGGYRHTHGMVNMFSISSVDFLSGSEGNDAFVIGVFGTVESVTNAKTCAVVPPLRLWFLHHYLVHEEALCLIKVGCFDEDTTLEAVVLLWFVNH